MRPRKLTRILPVVAAALCTTLTVAHSPGLTADQTSVVSAAIDAELWCLQDSSVYVCASSDRKRGPRRLRLRLLLTNSLDPTFSEGRTTDRLLPACLAPATSGLPARGTESEPTKPGARLPRLELPAGPIRPSSE